MPAPVSTYPKVVEVLEIEDHGPSDGRGSAACPHCGADGRYITRFVTEDGGVHGAMAGCFKLFPKSKYADRTERILTKQRDAARLGRNPASWDAKALDAIRNLKTLGEPAVDAILRECDAAKNAYIAKKFGGSRGR